MPLPQFSPIPRSIISSYQDAGCYNTQELSAGNDLECAHGHFQLSFFNSRSQPWIMCFRLNLNSESIKSVAPSVSITQLSSLERDSLSVINLRCAFRLIGASSLSLVNKNQPSVNCGCLFYIYGDAAAEFIQPSASCTSAFGYLIRVSCIDRAQSEQ